MSQKKSHSILIIDYILVGSPEPPPKKTSTNQPSGRSDGVSIRPLHPDPKAIPSTLPKLGPVGVVDTPSPRPDVLLMDTPGPGVEQIPVQSPLPQRMPRTEEPEYRAAVSKQGEVYTPTPARSEGPRVRWSEGPGDRGSDLTTASMFGAVISTLRYV